MQRNFFLLFFSGQWGNSGVPTPNFRGTYPQISSHFWMIQNMFKNKKNIKNKKKVREKEPKSEGPPPLGKIPLFFFF